MGGVQMIKWSTRPFENGVVIICEQDDGFILKLEQYIDHWLINDSGLNYIPITIMQMTDKIKLKANGVY